MIDLHAHILPGLDDGPVDMDQAMEMARVAVEDGIRRMVATPHYIPGLYNNTRDIILEACLRTNEALEHRGISLKIYPGCEARLHPELAANITGGMVTTLADQGRHVLVEFPAMAPEAVALAAVAQIRDLGIIPVLAHVERNPYLCKRLDVVEHLVMAGAWCQVTASSFLGRFGRGAMSCAKKLAAKDLVHVVGTDAHEAFKRAPQMSKAFKKIEKMLGEYRFDLVCRARPAQILGEE